MNTEQEQESASEGRGLKKEETYRETYRGVSPSSGSPCSPALLQCSAHEYSSRLALYTMRRARNITGTGTTRLGGLAAMLPVNELTR